MNRMRPSSYISVNRGQPSNLVFYANLDAPISGMYALDCSTRWKHIHIVSYGREKALAELIRELNEVLDSQGIPYSYNIEVLSGFNVKKV